MKKHVKTYQSLLLFGIGLIYLTQLKAQEPVSPKHKVSRVQIEINQNGKRTILDTTFTSSGPFHAEEYLKEHGIQPLPGLPATKTIIIDTDAELPGLPPLELPQIKLLAIDTMIIPEVKFRDCIIRISDTIAIPRYKTKDLENISIYLKEISKFSTHIQDSILHHLPEGLVLKNEDVKQLTIQEGDSTKKITRVILVTTTDKPVVTNKGNTSIAEAGSENRLLVYPNPGNGQFKISYETLKKGTITLKVTNANHQTIYQEKIKGVSGKLEKEINISGQPAGSYLLTIEQGNQQLSRKLIIE